MPTIDGFVDRALFISPIVDMEKLICDMMRWMGVSEDELREKKEIPTEFGETLLRDYLVYARKSSLYGLCRQAYCTGQVTV